MFGERTGRKSHSSSSCRTIEGLDFATLPSCITGCERHPWTWWKQAQPPPAFSPGRSGSLRGHTGSFSVRCLGAPQSSSQTCPRVGFSLLSVGQAAPCSVPGADPAPLAVPVHSTLCPEHQHTGHTLTNHGAQQKSKMCPKSVFCVTWQQVCVTPFPGKPRLAHRQSLPSLNSGR